MEREGRGSVPALLLVCCQVTGLDGGVEHSRRILLKVTTKLSSRPEVASKNATSDRDDNLEASLSG